MPAHAMSKNANSTSIHLFEILKHDTWQLLRDICVHLIPFAPGLLDSIDVKSSPAAEIIALVFALDLQPARAGVWV